MSIVPKCERCRYYKSGLSYGICRRFPPTIPPAFPGANPGYPEVEATDWCGEYAVIPKEEREVKVRDKAGMDKVVGAYMSGFRKAFGSEPVITVKDRVAAKNLISNLGADAAAEVVAAFISDPPRWNRERGLYDMRFIPAAANEILARKKAAAQSDDILSFLQEQSKEHRTNSQWYSYVDYVKKSGQKKTFEEWDDE